MVNNDISAINLLIWAGLFVFCILTQFIMGWCEKKKLNQKVFIYPLAFSLFLILSIRLILS